MELKVFDEDFTVCKIATIEHVDFSDEFCFVGKTDEELSLVCSTKCTPSKTIEREDGWKAFRIQGSMPFTLVGILSKLLGILAEEEIGIFAVSTFNTDYILTKAHDFSKAIEALEKHGYVVVR